MENAFAFIEDRLNLMAQGVGRGIHSRFVYVVREPQHKNGTKPVSLLS